MAKRKSKKSSKTPTAKARAFNKAAYHKAFKSLQSQVDKAWKKFCKDKKRKAGAAVMARIHKELLLLLGECNYFARECMRMSTRAGR